MHNKLLCQVRFLDESYTYSVKNDFIQSEAMIGSVSTLYAASLLSDNVKIQFENHHSTLYDILRIIAMSANDFQSRTLNDKHKIGGGRTRPIKVGELTPSAENGPPNKLQTTNKYHADYIQH